MIVWACGGTCKGFEYTSRITTAITSVSEGGCSITFNSNEALSSLSSETKYARRDALERGLSR